ncbi:MAG: bifunctional phosphoribosylaminoimidazolecarboxamide formyltransferase/IMP cyclohydrolase [Bacteroidales bacterium]|nr:bifunctional phosphoribosylaminoimidazolecarboxamide formyltransferase/IMP cyclohydrolase [Bacteroidales bacterium]
MNNLKEIETALVSVYNKENLEPVIKKLQELNIKIYSTGGTKDFIANLNINVNSIEDLTSYPSIIGGRVKTLHPKVFGGILARKNVDSDIEQLNKYGIPAFDLVIVDLYPFEETVNTITDEDEIIEKIDIGGISLIRAAAKNFREVLTISSRNQYSVLLEILEKNNGKTTVNERKIFAKQAFNITSHYDTMIFKYFNKDQLNVFKESIPFFTTLRYGENPHQKGLFFGKFEELFDKLNGKEISYNNLLDIDAAINLINEFEKPTFAIIKHNNACGLASKENLSDAWKDALAGDPVSAFGGIIISNKEINKETAIEINKLFFEVIIAPKYSNESFEILKQNTKRIILESKIKSLPATQFRSILNGVILQEKDLKKINKTEMLPVTKTIPKGQEYADLEFANKIVKHTKSNAIVLVKNQQLIASGIGQTSRVDALKQAINKAKSFGFDINGAVMASDAFFPFPDSVEIAYNEGVTAVIQPGGSIRDKESIDFCNNNNIAMIFTGIRHFKH